MTSKTSKDEHIAELGAQAADILEAGHEHFDQRDPAAGIHVLCIKRAYLNDLRSRKKIHIYSYEREIKALDAGITGHIHQMVADAVEEVLGAEKNEAYEAWKAEKGITEQSDEDIIATWDEFGRTWTTARNMWLDDFREDVKHKIHDLTWFDADKCGNLFDIAVREIAAEHQPIDVGAQFAEIDKEIENFSEVIGDLKADIDAADANDDHENDENDDNSTEDNRGKP